LAKCTVFGAFCTDFDAKQFAICSFFADRQRKIPVRPLRGKPNDLEFSPMFMRSPEKNDFVNGSYWERLVFHDWSYGYESNMLTIYPSVEIIRKGRWIGCLHDAVPVSKLETFSQLHESTIVKSPEQ
jgi:hypothetical protein